ncbi:BET1-like protein [Actinia tenebrosa]|uniref:BET1-like protein n=1 Tax=Actinia tenebrosa TaxID=6105 RepID=A0A6P8I4S0_ACTTE|nr:BET1-like protein [Actinia tenebrosa]
MASSHWGNSRGNKNDDKMDKIMESENNRLVDNLSNKVSMLKGIAIDIDRESKQQNKYLGGMGDDFGGAAGLLTGSAQRLSHMIASGKSNRKLMCYIIAGLVFLFVVLYYGLGRAVK